MPHRETGAMEPSSRPEHHRHRLSPRHLRDVTLRSLSRGFAPSRLELAAKAALAAGIAWAVAPFMPGPAAEHPYYAPLGALVSMYPTVAGSLRNGLQSLLGLALGIGVAVAVGSFAGTSALSVAAVIGIGILVGGLPGKPTASDWVPLAGLFVLVIGGRSPDDFSFAYMLQMAVGVAIGLAVNWLILPPLRFRGIAAASSRHVDSLPRAPGVRGAAPPGGGGGRGGAAGGAARRGGGGRPRRGGEREGEPAPSPSPAGPHGGLQGPPVPREDDLPGPGHH